MAIKIGTEVRQRAVVIEGQVTARRFNDDRDEMEYLVVWMNDGEEQSRWFLESEIEEAP